MRTKEKLLAFALNVFASTFFDSAKTPMVADTLYAMAFVGANV